MRIAALYDVHGNLPALEAVLDAVREAAADAIVVGGDVLPGPMPGECLDLLSTSGLPTSFIQGNGERDVLTQLAGDEPVRVPEPHRHVIRWTAEQLSPAHRQAIAAWPLTLQVHSHTLGDVLVCHATPWHDNEILTRETPESSLLPSFHGLGASLVVCGHTHMQFDRRVGEVRVVNAGSVGMPFGEPGAYWLLLDTDVRFQRTDYDLERAADRIRRSGFPSADDFATRSVLRPPSESEMIRLFERAARRVDDASGTSRMSDHDS